jgi:hypothetical protein
VAGKFGLLKVKTLRYPGTYAEYEEWQNKRLSNGETGGIKPES